jgi:hypothetical protein
MDINKALAELRAAFPRVTWLRVSSWGIEARASGRLVATVKKSEKAWVCADYTSGEVVDTDPVSAVRAWLAAQPTATFYPEAPSGETEEYAGWIAIGSRRDYGLCRDFGPGMEWESKQSAADGLDHHCDEARFHRFVIRVPAPVDPPVLVGEVSDV